MPLSPLEQEFLAQGEASGGELLLPLPGAQALVRRARAVGVPVLGLEGFRRLSGGGREPDLDQIADLSALTGAVDSWRAAEHFLTTQATPECWYVVVLAPAS